MSLSGNEPWFPGHILVIVLPTFFQQQTSSMKEVISASVSDSHCAMLCRLPITQPEVLDSRKITGAIVAVENLTDIHGRQLHLALVTRLSVISFIHQ